MKILVKTPSRLAAKLTPRLQAAVRAALPRISAIVTDEIGGVVSRKLHTTAAAYMKGLQDPASIQVSDDGVRISLQGELPRALEEGFSAFDMKPHMLRASGVKTGKGGSRYVDVGFRHGLQGTTRLRAMPADVRRQVQSTVRSKQRAGALRDAERVTGHAPGTVRDRKLRFGNASLPVKTKTKVGIYADMLRVAGRAGKRVVAQYKTIRRISSKSDPMSWWHPGYAGAHAFREAKTRVRSKVRAVLREELSKAVKR